MNQRLFPTLTRRSFLTSGGVGLVASLASPTLLRATARHEKSLFLYNMHTGEWFKRCYKEGERYVEESLRELSHFMRDRRSGELHAMDPKLYDLVHALQQSLRTSKPFELVCGYRSPTTNRKLHLCGQGVAKKSLHMSGKAVDLRLVGTPLKTLRDTAKAQRAGGVGYYPRSGFVHVDIRPRPTFW